MLSKVQSQDLAMKLEITPNDTAAARKTLVLPGNLHATCECLRMI